MLKRGIWSGLLLECLLRNSIEAQLRICNNSKMDLYLSHLTSTDPLQQMGPKKESGWMLLKIDINTRWLWELELLHKDEFLRVWVEVNLQLTNYSPNSTLAEEVNHQWWVKVVAIMAQDRAACSSKLTLWLQQLSVLLLLVAMVKACKSPQWTPNPATKSKISLHRPVQLTRETSWLKKALTESKDKLSWKLETRLTNCSTLLKPETKRDTIKFWMR